VGRNAALPASGSLDANIVTASVTRTIFRRFVQTLPQIRAVFFTAQKPRVVCRRVLPWLERGWAPGDAGAAFNHPAHAALYARDETGPLGANQNAGCAARIANSNAGARGTIGRS
jgi:hypothetical protein